ncbi:hypothetical protein [Clostridium sp. B9]|uniref:hypothetical protein n=1 Tax=Clostridium sp. B9 TaxID=3423224 RepID=UPI003D2EC294
MLKSFYGLLNSKKIEKSLMKFRKIPIKKVSEIILRECHKENLEYEIIKNNNHEFLIEINKGKKKTLIMFHKILAVTLYDYEKFSHMVAHREANKGFYITTGVFQEDVYHKTYIDNFANHIKIFDGKKFIASQRWIKNKRHEHISYDRLSFKSFY